MALYTSRIRARKSNLGIYRQKSGCMLLRKVEQYGNTSRKCGHEKLSQRYHYSEYDLHYSAQRGVDSEEIIINCNGLEGRFLTIQKIKVDPVEKNYIMNLNEIVFS